MYDKYFLSLGFTATAVSPRIVSGLVVAISTKSLESSARQYFICHILPFSSDDTTSRSESAV